MKKVTFLALLALVFSLGAGFLQAAEAASDDEFNNLPGVMNDLERPEADAQASEVPEAPAASAAVNDSARTDDSMYTGCAICCSGFRNEPTLSCANGEVAHTFHEACIAQAYTRRPGCPVCRSSVPGVPVGRLDPRFLFEAIDRRAGQDDTIDQLIEYFQLAFAAQNRVQLFERNREVQVPLDGRFYPRQMNAVQYALWKLPETEVMRVLDLDIDFAAALNRRMPGWNWTSLDIAWRLKRSVPLLRKLLAKGALANKRARDDEGWL
ncbi:hypothetical protein EBZ39_15495, partial [bacterium]|nr:hypothetical protein [bacterium]